MVFLLFLSQYKNTPPSSASHVLPASTVCVGSQETNAPTQVIILGLHFFFQIAIHLAVLTSKPMSSAMASGSLSWMADSVQGSSYLVLMALGVLVD